MLINKDAIAGKTEYPPCLTLKQKRLEFGLSQVDLAMLIAQHGLGNISSTYISKFENGRQKPWKSAREALCKITGLSDRALFPELISEDQSL